MNKRNLSILLFLLLALTACLPAQESIASLSPAIGPSPTSTTTPPPPASPTATAPPPTAALGVTNTPTARPSGTPTVTATVTATPTASATASATPWPTPRNLPPAPQGWRWELHAVGIPVTHYIVYELSAQDSAQSLAQPYGLDDQPLPGLDPLPRSFLLQVAYQGSGRLPNGDILQFAAERPPLAQGELPFRYLITPASSCDGHPVAGNGSCSVPFETAATTWRAGEEPLVPVGSTIFIPELGLKIYINDVALSSGPPKIDLYTGTLNNYDYERPDGAEIWILTAE